MMEKDENIIEVSHLGKSYHDGTDTMALSKVSFSIRRGEFVAIMGPSGSGKSTLLHLLGLLDGPTTGKYIFKGKNTAEYSDLELARIRNKEMGFVKSYKELNEIIDTNLKFLKEQEGKANLFEVDLAQVLSANQKQIKHILREFFLNATVRVGFALEISHVVECLESKADLDIDSGCVCD